MMRLWLLAGRRLKSRLQASKARLSGLLLAAEGRLCSYAGATSVAGSVAVSSPFDLLKRRLTLLTHRIYSLPVVILMPHGGCNCRCVMCDIWKANSEGREITPEELAPHVATFARLGVRRVVLSGGEALLHRNLWALCALLKAQGVKITLLSTGLLLRRHAADVARWCHEVTVSLDGSQPVHDAIRGVPRAYARLADGVAALKAGASPPRVTARCVLQRRNFTDLPNIIAAAHAIGLDGISFLAADVSSTAFNRAVPWSEPRAADVALSADEATAFVRVVEEVIAQNAADFASGFIAESPAKLRRLPRYYAALQGEGAFPPVACNAPWVSTVVEADGAVRPCFFHRPLGNLRDAPLAAILNSSTAVAFRRNLDVQHDPICRTCVCSLRLGARAAV